jgi:hypothetical protein
MKIRHPRSKPIPYKPHITVSTAQGEDPQGPGCVVAILHVTARDAILLRSYQIVGAPCEHLAGEVNPADQNETDKLIAQMQLVATQLQIPISIARDEISALVFAEEDLRDE